MRFFSFIFIIFFFSTTAFSQKIIKHKVKEGESISVIAKKHNVSENEIYELNPKTKGAILSLKTILSIPNKKYKSNNNITYSCTYHVVWCPKYRRKVLVGPVAARLKELIVETCTGLSVEIQEMEIMPDHVHLLLDIDPQFGVHKAVKRIKGFSSRVLRQEFKELTTKLPTLWSNSYFVSTVGGAPLEMIKQYIQSQKTSQRQ